jgi:hypothetical protein
MKGYILILFSMILLSCQFKSNENESPIPYDDYVKLFALQTIDDVRFQELKGRTRDSALVSSRQYNLLKMGYNDSVYREAIKFYNTHDPKLQLNFMHDLDSAITLIQKNIK